MTRMTGTSMALIRQQRYGDTSITATAVSLDALAQYQKTVCFMFVTINTG
jgi:hypothetical protein